MLVNVFYKKKYVGTCNVTGKETAVLEAADEFGEYNEAGLPTWDIDDVTVFPSR